MNMGNCATEHEPVCCPYCGHEMTLFYNGKLGWAMYGCCNSQCESYGPSASTPEEAYQKAKSLYRPMQRPMTLEEVKAHIGFKDAGDSWEATKYWARPLYLDVEQKTLDDYMKACHKDEVFCHWGVASRVLALVAEMEHCPGIYNTRLRFWRDEPTERERNAAKWEELNGAAEDAKEVENP